MKIAETGWVAVMKVMIDDRWAGVAPAMIVGQALSESTGARRFVAFGSRPDSAGGRCLNALGVSSR
jgi:hypothetical protein